MLLLLVSEMLVGAGCLTAKCTAWNVASFSTPLTKVSEWNAHRPPNRQRRKKWGRKSGIWNGNFGPNWPAVLSHPHNLFDPPRSSHPGTMVMMRILCQLDEGPCSDVVYEGEIPMLVINRGFRVIINQHKLCAINKRIGLPLGCSNQSEMVGKNAGCRRKWWKENKSPTERSISQGCTLVASLTSCLIGGSYNWRRLENNYPTKWEMPTCLIQPCVCGGRGGKIWISLE